MSEIRLIKDKISLAELEIIAQESFGDMVKAVADCEQKIMAVGGEMHADEESFLLAKGSQQANLWGINLYPDKPFEEMIEFDSIINIRPNQNNRSRNVENDNLRQKIKEIVKLLIEL